MINDQEGEQPKALITGFSSGIGFAYAQHLAKQGWYLELVSQDPIRAQKAYELLAYPHSRYHLADLSNIGGIKTVTEKVDSPELIIANAGITKFGEVGGLKESERKDLFYLLCLGVIDLLEEYVPAMITAGKGRIVIVSSIGAITPMPKSSIYASAKSAINSYGQSLAKELYSKNISVTVSLPGYVKTEAHAKAGLTHLRDKVPEWMWVSADQVVLETEKASLNKKSKVIPGIVYKVVSPFLNMSLANKIWNKMTKRGKS